jgi:phosphatidylethanolamine/phosphatidyl-N-methylethanolamine N-methyltransferase
VFSELGRKKPKTIGAVSHSSVYLAREITTNITSCKSSKRILEVGAGIGIFSDEIVNKMSTHDQLDLIELEPDLCEILEKKYKEHPNVHIHCKSIVEWNPKYKYDIIVSGLPFNAFEADFVSNILKRYELLSKANCELSFFEYIFMSPFAKKGTTATVSNFTQKNYAKKSYVLRNLPPARVYRMKINQTS